MVTAVKASATGISLKIEMPNENEISIEKSRKWYKYRLTPIQIHSIELC